MRIEWFDASGVRLISETAGDDPSEVFGLDDGDGRFACGASHCLVILSASSSSSTTSARTSSKPPTSAPLPRSSLRRIVHAMGDNSQSQLGRGIDLDNSDDLEPVLGATFSASRVAAGDAHSVAVDEEGRVWSWGGSAIVRGRHGPASVPMVIEKGLLDARIRVTSVACGTEHSLALDREGRVFAWGCCENGRAGVRQGGAENVLRPRQVDLPSGLCVVRVACGAEHSVLLSSDLRVFATGRSPANGMDLDSDRFMPVEALCMRRQTDPVMTIACGYFHTLVSTSKQVLAFGDGSCGKLGNGSEHDTHVPVAIEFEGRQFGATSIAAGKHHSLVLEENGDLWVFGLDHVLREMVGDKEDALVVSKRAPLTVALPKMFARPVIASNIKHRVLHIQCGAEFSLVLSNPESLRKRPVQKTMTTPSKATPGSPTRTPPPSKTKIPPLSPRVSSVLLSGGGEDDANLTIITLSRLLKDQETRTRSLQQGIDTAVASLETLVANKVHEGDPTNLAGELQTIIDQMRRTTMNS